MKSPSLPSLLFCAVALATCMQAANAGTVMSLQWSDPGGDAATVGDVVSVSLSFDSSGAWTATWLADAAHPFTGNARFNLNMFDTALGDLSNASAPQLSLDGFHDFGTSSATMFSYSGQAGFLTNWQVGDSVSTGNSTNFISGLVSVEDGSSRDSLLSSAAIVSSVPEPASVALLALGLATTLALKRRRKR